VSAKKGLPPGTLVHIGKQSGEKVRISVMSYDEDHYRADELVTPDRIPAYRDGAARTWINIDGLDDVQVIEQLGKIFGLHPLVLEDILNTHQRPKFEDHDDYLFIVIRMLSLDAKTYEIASEQLSLIVGPNYLLTFQEVPGDDFDGVRQRLEIGKERMRKGGPDYLAYALIDTVVDNYFVILEKLSERIEMLEEELVSKPSIETLRVIHRLKRDIVFLRRSIWPLREVANRLTLGDTPLIKPSTIPYFRDVYDHAIHVIDTMETFRDIVSGMLDIYLSSVSNRLNEVMKVLTIIATIFIPLTFLSGWYGMNFKDMPELSWRWGYPMVICIALTVAVGLLLLFRKKKWL